MKTLLLFGSRQHGHRWHVPSLPAKIILSAVVLLTALTYAAGRAPIGCQDEGGFHITK